MGIIYIRVVKFICTREDKDTLQITTAITLTSDLGESSHPLPATLQCTIANDKSQIKQTLQWSGLEAVQRYKFTSKSIKSYNKELHISIAAQNTSIDGIDEVDHYFEPITSFFSEDSRGALIVPVHFSHELDGSFTQTTRRTLKISSHDVTFTEHTKESIVSHIWDGGLVLAALVASITDSDHKSPRQEQTHKPRKRRKQTVKSGEESDKSDEKEFRHLQATLVETLSPGTRVVELGTGIGLVGTITSWLPGLDITLTDLSTARILVETNVASASGPSKITFDALDWEDEEVKSYHVDVLMMSDVTYNESYHDALATCIKRLARTGIRIIFSSKYRHVSERPFIEYLTSTYRVLARAVFDKDRFNVKQAESTTQIGDVEVLILEN